MQSEIAKRFSSPQKRKVEIMRLLTITVGAFLVAFFMNIFIVPMGMYSGGFTGVAQIIRTIVNKTFNINTGSFDYAGIIAMCMNVPLFLAARKSMGAMYLFRSVYCILSETFFFSIIPIPQEAIIDNMLAAAIIGGVGEGLGGGLILRSAGSGGGMDFLGAALIRKYENMSMSLVGNSVNAVVFGAMFFMFGAEKVIYSLIASAVYPIVVDRTYSQNINVEVHIIVKRDDGEMAREILSKLGRGLTKWQAMGVYSGEDKEIYYALVNKYELNRMVSLVRKHDPNAIIVQNVGVRISGPFEKRVE